MPHTWFEQREIDLLVASGFAELDADATRRNAERWAMEGGSPANEYLLRPMYRWTAAGKIACHLYRYTTPMAYAQALHESTVRHCVHCGRCTARQKVGCRVMRGSRQVRNRTVCLNCHAAGKRLS